ncbi:uncharacterized protein [Rutidosis leptorrhynchoides]|uniref:uncharacterized protein n=1 Tax=Rutidosis leptorrhynchoides TaxID=125765 RepID=UPI003A98DE15
MRSMSFGGRLVLLKSVLNNLPLYYFTIFRAPPCVLKILESVRRNFFWGGDHSGSKIPWVNWVTTCLPYGRGGLNIGSFKSKNLALLAKWWWRFKTETNCLWSKIIRSIYGIDSGLRSGDGLARLSTSGIWNNIIFAGNQIEDLNIIFISSFKKSIGDGSSTEFWNEVWCGADSYKNIFPRLFRLEVNKDIMVSGRITARTGQQIQNNRSGQQLSATGQEGYAAASDFQEGLGRTGHTQVDNVQSAVADSSRVNVYQSTGQSTAGLAGQSTLGSVSVSFVWEWIREPTGRTAGELQELCNLLRSFSFDFNRQESWKWALASNGIFEVRKLTHVIDEKLLRSDTQHTHETLRNNLVPKKLEVFVRRALRKRLPVRIKLDKRGIDLYSVRCPVCDDGLESVDHVLFECKLSLDVWNRVYKWWNLANIPGPSEFLRGKSAHSMSSLGSKIWQAVEWICAYSLWKNRNSLVFQGKSCISAVILNEIQVKSFEWISARIKGSKIDWHCWLVNPYMYFEL